MGCELSPECVESLRRVPGRQKLATAFSLYRGARRLKAAALRQQHPDWTEDRIRQRVKEIFLHAGA